MVARVLLEETMKDKYDIQNPTDFLRLHLRFAMTVVQQGKMGQPTQQDLEICGKLHAILEELG